MDFNMSLLIGGLSLITCLASTVSVIFMGPISITNDIESYRWYNHWAFIPFLPGMVMFLQTFILGATPWVLLFAHSLDQNGVGLFTYTTSAVSFARSVLLIYGALVLLAIEIFGGLKMLARKAMRDRS